MRNIITFTKPGNFDLWEQHCQPIGNGYMGASFFGGIAKEKIVLNEKTLWAGGPSESRPDYNSGIIEDSYKYVKQVQEHLYNGEYEKARSLVSFALQNAPYMIPLYKSALQLEAIYLDCVLQSDSDRADEYYEKISKMPGNSYRYPW